MQAQWGHLNHDESALTLSQSLWVDDHHTLQMAWRSAAWKFVNFTGTAGVWRASAIEAAGGVAEIVIVGGADLYRARVSQLISKGGSFARIEEGRVVFKAEVAAASPYACQVQGVYVDPARRGEGLAAAGMAAVVSLALADIAPVVSLYVNDHNEPARRAYARVGFEQTRTFTTIMF